MIDSYVNLIANLCQWLW